MELQGAFLEGITERIDRDLPLEGDLPISFSRQIERVPH